MYNIVFKDKKYVIVESSSENEIAKFDKSIDATKLKADLQSGRGFNGWTPLFVIDKYTKGDSYERDKFEN